MSRSLVQGKDIILKIQRTGVFYPVACNASCSLNIDTDMLETTFYDDGSFKAFIPSKHNMTLEGSGPIFFDDNLIISDLISLQLARTLIQWEFTLVARSTTTITYSGSGYISHSDMDGSMPNSNCNYSIQVSGAPTITATSGSGSVTVHDAYYTATGGETTVGFPAAIGGTAIEIEREGIGMPIILSGTPAGNQVKFTAATGNVDFAIALAAGEIIHIIYMN